MLKVVAVLSSMIRPMAGVVTEMQVLNIYGHLSGVQGRRGDGDAVLLP